MNFEKIHLGSDLFAPEAETEEEEFCLVEGGDEILEFIEESFGKKC